jgi:chorismate mutase / prephenate dehydratase
MKLEETRKLIDEIDTEILELLNRRAEMSLQIGRIKMQAGLPIEDPDREALILRRLVRESEGSIDDKALLRIYRQVLAESRRLQKESAAEIAAGAGNIQ